MTRSDYNAQDQGGRLGDDPAPGGNAMATFAGGTSKTDLRRSNLGSALFGRGSTSDLPLIERAEGIRVWDRDGREYLDASSGAVSVNSIGQGVEDVVEAMAGQARRFGYVHGAHMRHEVAEELAQALARFAPGRLNRALFVSGGSEANETAIKLARQYQTLRGRPDRHVVLSRRRSYHGATLGALSLSGFPTRRAPYLPLLAWEPRVAEANCYRCPLGLSYPGCDLACACDLERAVEEVGPDRVAAFIAEPIVAAAGPGMTPPPGYFARVREICDRHDVLFIADEVVTGLGRTGRNFGIEHWGVEPDVIVTAKGLSGGYVPFGAVLVGDRVAAVFEDRGARFTHGYTYRDRLVENAAVQGEHLFRRLRELAETCPLIGDVRGRGLLAGIELVADRETKRPFDPGRQVMAQLLALARERGLLLYPGAGNDGTVGDQFLVTPPLIVTRADVDTIVDRLALALADLSRVCDGHSGSA
jgi:adenosylmethionine-8-amino-7-oxononanoate aminotransferase